MIPQEVQTFSFLDSKLSLNGIAITDFSSDITIGPVDSSGNWNDVEGPGGTVVRGRNVRTLYKCDFSIYNTSPQLTIIDALEKADASANAGPFPFVYTSIGGNFSIIGQAWIKENKAATIGKAPEGRAISLSVKVNLELSGNI